MNNELRALLERIANNPKALSRDAAVSDQVDAIQELRALLSAPKCSLCRDLGDTCIECEKASSVTRLQAEVETLRAALRTEVEAGDSWKREAQDLRTELDALKAKPQGEPVAKLHAERLTGKDGEYGITVENSEWLNTCRLTGGVFNLYAEQPAPVAVVLPERRPFPCSIRDTGWNACLDEVARLNPGAKP